MKRLNIIISSLFLCLSPCVFAFDYASTVSSAEHSAQLRTGADFTKNFRHGVKLRIGEDLRFDLYNSASGVAFSKSYTSLALSYAPIKYFKIDGGYTLKILGTKDWSDYNEWLRHRVFFSVTGSYKVNRVKLSVRERVMCEMRTDSVNPLEKAQNAWMLRSKLMVEYSCLSKPLKPYIWVELVNTLNAPEYQQKYKNNDPTNNGYQYIRRVRTAVGLTWKIDKRNALDFYYRFNYGYDRDINIKKKSGKIELTEEKSFQHAIGVAYNLGW